MWQKPIHPPQQANWDPTRQAPTTQWTRQDASWQTRQAPLNSVYMWLAIAASALGIFVAFVTSAPVVSPIITLGFMTLIGTLAWLDQREVSAAGYDKSSWWIAPLLLPAYLVVRRIQTRENQWPVVVNVVTTVGALFLGTMTLINAASTPSAGVPNTVSVPSVPEIQVPTSPSDQFAEAFGQLSARKRDRVCSAYYDGPEVSFQAIRKYFPGLDRDSYSLFMIGNCPIG